MGAVFTNPDPKDPTLPPFEGQPKKIKESDLLSRIEIDLPSADDVKVLADARKDEITNNYDGKEYYYKYSTDLARLTGKDHYNDYFYLRDKDTNNAYNILFDDGGIHSFEIRDNKKNINSNRFLRTYLIRPTLRFDKCPELFNYILSINGIDLSDEKNKPKYAKVLFGFIPRYSVNKGIQYYLNNALKRKSIVKTDKVFTWDSVYVHDYHSLENNVKRKFSPLKNPVYEHDGKKYVRIKVKQCGYTFGNRLLDKSDSITLTNKIKYHNGDRVWLMISEIPWIVDIERKTFIAQEGLISGIQFDNYDKKNNPVEYNDSNIKWFLKTLFLPQILQFTIINLKDKATINHKTDNSCEEEQTENSNSKKNELTALIKTIRYYEKYYIGSENIEAKVQELYNQYKEDILNISQEQEHSEIDLHLGIKDPSYYYRKLITSLQNILNELQDNSQITKDYWDMIEILNECLKEKIDVNKDEICQDVYNIKNVLISFITNQKIRDELNKTLDDIITNNINRIKKYCIEYKQNTTREIKTMDELRRELAIDFEPFLKRLNEIRTNQNIVNDILNSTKEMIKNQFIESKTNVARNYLNGLNEVISNIVRNGTQEDIEKLETLNENYDVGTSTEEIIKILKLNIKIAYQIELEMIERQERERENKELSSIDIDIPAIFSENNNDEEKTK